MSEHLPAVIHGIPPSKRRELAAELRQVHEEAQRKYNETDLLVAVLRDHIRDLQAERDRLRAELEASRETRRLEEAGWLWRGTRGPH